MRSGRRRGVALAALCAVLSGPLAAQPIAEFEVVSIKRNLTGESSAGMQTLPDGSFRMMNLPIRSIILAAADEPLQEVADLPAWVDSERYDIIARAPAGATRAQGGEMLRAMLRDRLKVAAHVERQERSAYALVVARPDGRFGSQLKPSTLDCTPGAQPAAPPRTPAGPVDFSSAAARCGLAMRQGEMLSGGVTMDQFARSLRGAAGSVVTNRTNLAGAFALTLTFSRLPAAGAAAASPAPDRPPDIFTALQEQLGLKLVPEKTMVPVLVVDHIERPSPD